MPITTRDVGLAIRDFIEGQHFSHINSEGEETSEVDTFEFVDCSDPDNMLVCTRRGRFRIRIFAE